MSQRAKAITDSTPRNATRRRYESPLTGRYGSAEMSYIFSPQFKFSTWRKLWVALAVGERMLGLPISEKQIKQLEKHVDDINFDVAEAKEKEIRHDVMSHVYAYGQQAPDAKGIIHLGATSAYVTDNTDLIQIRAGLELVAKKLVNVINALAKFADEYADLPTLAYTHFQAAQPTTVGKRACLWIQDLLLDLEDIERVHDTLP
ncbi:MAG TPA: lyase family protein, partial [Planctomycetota bacterium]|nr:lyase family protein [Planctomycetota bacterium]